MTFRPGPPVRPPRGHRLAGDQRLWSSRRYTGRLGRLMGQVALDQLAAPSPGYRFNKACKFD